MKNFIINLCAVLLLVYAADMQAEDRFQTIRLTYENRLDAINSDYDKQKEDVYSKYITSLVLLEKSVKRKGNLDALISVRQEIKRFQEEKVLSSLDLAGIDDSLKAVQQACLRDLKKIEIEWAGNVSRLCSFYNKALVKVEKKLTARDKLDQALEVREERKRLKLCNEFSHANKVLEQAKKESEPKPDVVNEKADLFLGEPTIQGFQKIISASSSGVSDTYRKEKVMSYWAYAGEGQHIEWMTAKVPSNQLRKEYVFVWGGSNNHLVSDFDLFVNDTKLLTFKSGTKDSARWQSGGASLAFEYKNDSLGYGGVFKLSVPSSLVKRGNAQKIRIESAVKQKSPAWMKIHGFKDVKNDIK